MVAPYWLGETSDLDRPLGGTMGFGAHTHFSTGPVEWVTGADLVFIGEQTGMTDLQDSVHVLFGYDRATSYVNDNAIDDALRLAGKVEIGLPYEIDPNLSIRPFLEFAAGVETYGRIGVDIVLGAFGSGALLAREEVTGHRYLVTKPDTDG